jgi:DNA topoisomerase-1
MPRPDSSRRTRPERQRRPRAHAAPDDRTAGTVAGEPVPAGLVWVCDTQPGIHRQRAGEGFAYVDADDRPVRDEETLARIRRLAIPPAYESVWICADPDGHLQATGRDARGRKQYRYHPVWQQERGADKFDAMRTFGVALARIRDRVQRDLAVQAGEPPTRTLVLATLVRLLDTTFLRIGNEEYARGNGSYGLTTLRCRHAGVRAAQVRLSFQGKSGVRHEVRLDDARVAAVVRRCRQLPGQELFQYCDPDGSVRRITSADVNDYLADAAGVRVTAKDFRTWHGSVLALEFTRRACTGECVRGAAKAVVVQVAQRLGNTAAVCRKSYIHPQVLALGDALADADARAALLHERWARPAAPAVQARRLSAAERRLLALLGAPPPARGRSPKARTPPAPAQGCVLDGNSICLPPEPANAFHRRNAHAQDLGLHDARRAGRPSRREPAARRAGDG